MRKFTFAEVTKLCGRLQLFALSFLCEVCDRKRQAEMSVITMTGVPIYVCLTCATELVQVSTAHRDAMTKQLQLRSGKKETPNNGTNGAHATKKRGRPRKAAR